MRQVATPAAARGVLLRPFAVEGVVVCGADQEERLKKGCNNRQCLRRYRPNRSKKGAGAEEC